MILKYKLAIYGAHLAPIAIKFVNSELSENLIDKD